MDQKDVLKAIGLARSASQKRNFAQTFDLIVTLKGLDLKKADQQVDFFTSLHFPVKKRSICAFVGPELVANAKETCDEMILVDDFPKYDKKSMKKLAEKHDFFIAQATVMPKVAAAFGRVFGPKGKMPNPKAGCVVPPNANLKNLYERLQMIVNIKAKAHLMIQTKIGLEAMPDAEIAENLLAIYDQIIHHLPQEKNNVKSVIVKLTMGKPVVVGDTSAQLIEEPKKGAKKAQKKDKGQKKEEGSKDSVPVQKDDEQPAQEAR